MSNQKKHIERIVEKQVNIIVAEYKDACMKFQNNRINSMRDEYINFT